MDFTADIHHVPKVFWWLIISAVIVACILGSALAKGPKSTDDAKGYSGELRVRIISWLMLARNTYHRLHDVMLRSPDGITQIDHIFVSRFGVFVLETKNMRGWIFGKENEVQWTQKIYGHTRRFQNPLRQNFKHLKAVETALQIPANTIHSVVVFTGRSSFKTNMPANVTSSIGFVRYIKRFRNEIFTEEQVNYLVSRLETKRLPSTSAVRRWHAYNLKQRSNPNAHWRCPKCGSSMIIRTAKQGAGRGRQFWACSAYPKCRFTQNVA